MKKPKDLKDIEFPKCMKKCEVAKFFDITRCEECCPHKFDAKVKK